jgi:isopentenyldiphosphate isomerase
MLFDDDDEILDLVNDNDEIITQKNRSEIYASGICNFRVINAFIMNNQNQLWIPRRSANKKLFPLCLDASVGGHVKAGETYLQAFERELQEELNLSVQDISYSCAAYLNPKKNNVSAYMNVYIISYNQTPKYNTKDFIDSMWITIPELQKIIQHGEKTKGDLPTLINTLYAIYKS